MGDVMTSISLRCYAGLHELCTDHHAASCACSCHAHDLVHGEKILPDGRQAAVVPLTFGRARLTAGPPERPWYDDGW